MSFRWGITDEIDHILMELITGSFRSVSGLG